MKIAFITVDAPFGKKETYIINELEAIAKVNKDIFILPIRGSDRLSSSNTLNRSTLEYRFTEYILTAAKQIILHFPRIVCILTKLILSQKTKRFLYSIYILPKTMILVDCIQKEKIRHIHAYWGTTAATCALIASYLTQAPFSFTVHRADILADDILKIKANRARFIRSISSWGKKIARSHNIEPQKIKVVHLGVALPKILPIKKRKKILNLVCVSSLEKHKRILTLVKKVAQSNNLRLDIFGEGSQKSKISKFIKEHRLSSRIKLRGSITQKKLFLLYRSRKFDLFILASEIEGIPVSAMEAMAYLIPVALTKVGGVGELIDPKNAYVLKPDLGNLNKILHKIPEKDKLYLAYDKIRLEHNVKETSLGLLNLINACE